MRSARSLIGKSHKPYQLARLSGNGRLWNGRSPGYGGYVGSSLQASERRFFEPEIFAFSQLRLFKQFPSQIAKRAR
jgi:hypothetical protein